MNMLAANDQENRVRSLQAGAAGKSLHAGLKGFNAKTPGHKAPNTPYKVPLNDENAVLKAGKSVLKPNGKANENLLMTAKKGGKSEDNAFVTPAGPRNRAPLGMKTTNARAKAFQTPAPLSGSAKTQKISPRLRRPKVKVHQPEVQDEAEDNVPDIEYMPPKEIPLPDEMEGWPDDYKFPMFQGKNMTKGIYEVYHNPVEDDGRTRGEREFEEGLARDKKDRDKEFDRLFSEAMERDEAEMRRDLGIESPKKALPKSAPQTTLGTKKTLGPSTIKAKSAAAALSPIARRTYVAPTAATKYRTPAGLVAGRKPAKAVMAPSTTRHAAATAASKSTIGYAQGRAARPATRKPLSNVTRPTPSSAVSSRRPTTASSTHSRNTGTNTMTAKPRGAFSRSSSTSTSATLVAPPPEEQPHRTPEDVENEMRLLLLQDYDDDGTDAWASSFNNQLGGDPLEEDFEGFQFQLPEGL
ncbi:hypothetical protein BDV95DRAFT_513376 [Massariosphaeria phaeospora]|uniref:Uncharacterized protein n=1 Tax=Massariosphaeria phaeospora TaxID=100035 RepID=A0A7C8MTX5_9PLEO|nr:hypothetical protein BDV95DRAFT_513376 [Massariosphaeria phaeospora]